MSESHAKYKTDGDGSIIEVERTGNAREIILTINDGTGAARVRLLHKDAAWLSGELSINRVFLV